jgi:hypothetical protein
LGGGTLRVDDRFGFLHQAILTQVGMPLVDFAKTILESPNFVVYIDKNVYVRLICQNVLPLSGFYSLLADPMRTYGFTTMVAIMPPSSWSRMWQW